MGIGVGMDRNIRGIELATSPVAKQHQGLRENREINEWSKRFQRKMPRNSLLLILINFIKFIKRIFTIYSTLI